MDTKQLSAKSLVLSKVAFRSKEIVAEAEQSDISKRTVDMAIAESASNGFIIQCRQGLYIAKDFVDEHGIGSEAVLAVIADTFKEGHTISLQSALVNLDTAQSGNLYLSISEGHQGLLQTQLGNIHIHSISGRMIGSVERLYGKNSVYAEPFNTGRNGEISIKRHTPEMAALLMGYMELCGSRASYKLANIQQSILSNKMVKGIDWEKVGHMASSVRVPQGFIDTVKDAVNTKLAHQAMPNKNSKPKEPSNDSPTP